MMESVTGPSSTPTPRAASTIRPREDLYAPIASQMAQVEDMLRRELRSRYAELQPVLRHAALMGGKRLRPALVLLSGAAAGSLSEDHVTIAAVLEMVHTATLVHDDVLDSADHRRHLPTVNAKWDDSTSILLGDYLFSHSFYLAATLDSVEACRRIGEAARGVCEGELRQVLSRGDAAMDEEKYFELIRGKTAELTRVSCLLGARLAGGSNEAVQSLARFGESVGVAFQIADDYLDLWGAAASVGKSLGSDLRQAKPTLPLIRFLATADPQRRRRALELLAGPAEGRFESLRPMLDDSDAGQYTIARARTYAAEAIDALAIFEPTAPVHALSRLARFAVDREF